MSIYTFEPLKFVWDSNAKTTRHADYDSVQMSISLFDNTDFDTYKTWLNGDAVKSITNDSSKGKLTAGDLTGWASAFNNYSSRCIQVAVQFKPIQTYEMVGGFCIYIASWAKPTDPNNPNINLVNEALGISCNTVKATSGPTVNTSWNSPDFRSFWLPVAYKSDLDAGKLNLWDDTNTILQGYRTSFSPYRGL